MCVCLCFEEWFDINFDFLHIPAPAGGYDKEEKAARAYDLAALKYWGPTTTINFPVIFFIRTPCIKLLIFPIFALSLPSIDFRCVWIYIKIATQSFLFVYSPIQSKYTTDPPTWY